MKMMLFTSILAALLLSACSPSPSSDTVAPKDAAAAGDMAMSEAEHAKMADKTAAPQAEAAMAKTASATGTVEAVDAAAGKITIAHGPVEALQWPAMTMAFKATPEQIASVQAGQKVRFEFRAQGMEATITQIMPDQ
ncbi:copper-binding protein (plasmid) [Xanthomonas hortorum pv. hederae]